MATFTLLIVRKAGKRTQFVVTNGETVFFSSYKRADAVEKQKELNQLAKAA